MTSHDGEAWHSRQATARALILAEAPPQGAAGSVAVLQRLCRGLSADLGMLGAAVHLMSATGSGGVAAASDAHCKSVDELQFTTGEGPCHEAFASRRPVLTPDLRSAAGRRWPGYSAAAIEAGVGAVFAFPLHVGGVGLGVLDVYRDRPGSLGEEEVAMALTFAQIATEILLDGGLTTIDGNLVHELATALDYRAEIHQAQGMLMVSLGVSLEESLVRMRAHAFAHGRPLIDLAREIIAGRDHLGEKP
ncbi:MAG: GAF and ANTAR domain-containing protein [Actinomycetota bacterium]|nr:GAF and ANTAR domain-containing protein [Actinomycetota bacterium]